MHQYRVVRDGAKDLPVSIDRNLTFNSEHREERYEVIFKILPLQWEDFGHTREQC